MGPGSTARRPTRVGDPPGDAAGDPDRDDVRLALDRVPADRRRLRLPEPSVRRWPGVYARVLRVRDLDPAVGGPVGLAPLHARLRAPVPGACRVHGQRVARGRLDLVHDARGHPHHERRECGAGPGDPRVGLPQLRPAPTGHVGGNPRGVRHDAPHPRPDSRERGPRQARRLLGGDRRVGVVHGGRDGGGHSGRGRSQPGVQPARDAAHRPDRVDIAAMGDLQQPAERRDQERRVVPRPDLHHHRIARS